MNTGVAVIILVILLTDNWTAACLFGSSAACSFRCHCANNAVCDVTTGQCPDQCKAWSLQPSIDVTRYDWRGPACQIGNVALDKTASQSGVWGGLVAGNAVDGRLGDDGNANCAHPNADSGSPAWWRVDLGSIHAIHNVTVFNTHDTSGAGRMKEFDIGVGNTTNVTEHTMCASHGSPAVAAGGDVTLTCNSPVYGRYVSFRRTGGDERHLVTICEFVVIGYKQTYAACSNCASYDCDDILGCMECYPPYSNVPICDEGCAAGFYGDGCSSTCGSCRDSAPCRYTDGTCPDGCIQWYTGDKCDLHINERALSPSSNPSTAIASSSTSIDVKWKSEEGIPDSLLSYYGYVVKYGLSGSNDKNTSHDVPHKSNQSHHSITISGLQPATTYVFQVFIYRKQQGTQEVAHWGANEVTATTKSIATNTPAITTTKSTPSSSALTSSSTPPTTPSSSSGTTSTAGTYNSSVQQISPSSTTSKPSSTSIQSDTDVGLPQMSPATIGGVAAGASGLLIIAIVAIALICRSRRNNEVVGIMESPKPYSISNDDMIDEDTADNYAAEGPYEKIDDEAIPDGSTCIPVNQLAAYIRDLSSSGDGFEREFENLPKENYDKYDVGNLAANYNKNRFANIRPFDVTRVVLEAGHDEGPHADYINASQIKASNNNRTGYIASQGPKKDTVHDLWRLVWQENINRVVMATGLVENMVKKCEQYWPSGAGESKTYGKITVTTAVDDTYADYAYRLFRIQHGEYGETRDVHQLHFLSWIDKHRPEDAFTLLDFHRRIRSFDSKAKGPLLVHCSAGVGRTGTLIALDMLLDQAALESRVDVFSCVYRLRTQRMRMVQTLSQYIFLHKCLQEGLECGNKAIPCGQFDGKYKSLSNDRASGSSMTKLEEEFQLLTRLKHAEDEREDEGTGQQGGRSGNLPENQDKNRSVQVIPNDRHRPSLTSHQGEGDYINAIFLNTYMEKKAMLLTQMPLEHTVGDFWRLVHQQKCHQIVMLNTTSPDDLSCVAYWPDGEESTAHYGQIEVELTETNTTDHPNIVIRRFNVIFCKSQEREEMIKVSYYHLQGWPRHNSLPPHPGHLLELIEMLNRGGHSNKNSKLLVHCMDGAERSGLFAAAKYMVDKLKVDQEVDVFLACRHVTSKRPQAIHSMEQYTFLYDLAQTYMYDFGQYANFTQR